MRNNRQAYPSLQPGTIRLDPGQSRWILTFTMALGGLFLLDVLTTQVILGKGGVELNPAMAGIVAYPALHIAIKSATLLLALAVSFIAERKIRGTGIFLSTVLVLMYTGILANNLAVLIPMTFP
ncbi:MAG: DUF5658 family protein [Methanoregula sp.]|nr:DUF5658 family protein [Methanoregula sp.]